MKRVRLKDVAAVAGVSQGTVSNVFNKPDLVAQELRAHVLATAARLGYTGPQPAARVLRSGKVGLVALLTDESAAYLVSDVYGRRLLAGAARACDAGGVGLTIVGGDVSDGKGAGWSVENALVDGFVLHCFEDDDTIFERVRRRGLPVVTVDGPRAGVPGEVGIDDEGAAFSALAALTAAGHRRIGILSLELSREGGPGPILDPDRPVARYRTSQLRLKGYVAAARAAGIAPADLCAFETQNDAASVRDGVAYLMDREKPPTAIAAMSDVIAMVTLAALRDKGLSVPHDVSLVGFDGVEEAAYVDPPLTTVMQPAEEKGEAAVEILLGQREAQPLLLPTRLVERASIAPPPK